MKGERIAQLELLLKAHPEGLRKADIARRIGVHRSTVGRYIEDLRNYDNVVEENNLVRIEAGETEDRLELSIYESLALNMGAEMLLSNSQFQSPHLASGLRKIAMNMLSYAPKIAQNIASLADDAEKRSAGEAKVPNKILDVLIDAWVSGRIVKISHRADHLAAMDDEAGKRLDASETEETELAPYFIGFVDGESGRNPITVTGRLRHSTEIVTIDISRIVSVEILNETYTIPDNLRAFAHQDAKMPVEMVVDVIRVTLETADRSALNSFRSVVHGPIKTEKQPGGKYLCMFDAENSIELILRIIQCGDSVKIISPESLRKRFVKTMRDILSVYDGKGAA